MIRFEHIRKEYPDITPLRDVCAELEEGKIYSLIGPSGTGKSTFMRMINGLEKPTSGKIFYRDLEITAKETDMREVNKRIGMVFQHFNLFNHLTILDNLVIPQMDVLGKSREEATDKAYTLLEKVGLERTAEKMPRMLSGGQKQRIAIARALAMDPEVILFDEPTSALDPGMTNVIRDLILSLKDGARTLMIVTHDMVLAEEVSDEVLYFDEGIIYERGTPHQIFHEQQKPRTLIFIEQIKKLEICGDSNSIIFEDAVCQINEYCSQLKLPYTVYNQIVAVVEELIVEKLCHQKELRKIRLTAIYDAEEKCMYYAVQYSGSAWNPFDEDNLSTRILKNIIKDISFESDDSEEYDCIIQFCSK